MKIVCCCQEDMNDNARRCAAIRRFAEVVVDRETELTPSGRGTRDAPFWGVATLTSSRRWNYVVVVFVDREAESAIRALPVSGLGKSAITARVCLCRRGKR